MILDGWGLRDMSQGNAPAIANTPNFDRVWAHCPAARLVASGMAVGLPRGQMGNSEVGHTTIGAGRTVLMDLPRIDHAIDEGSFASAPALLRFAERLRETGGTAHVMGLLSPGGVHSHQRHLCEAARALAMRGVPVALHLWTDGRDTAPESALGFLEDVERDLAPEAGRGEVTVATLMGRFFPMDRDRRWDRVSKAWSSMVLAEGRHAATAREAIDRAYARGERDEFIEPTVIGGYSGLREGRDGIFCVNFRADRAREIIGALVDPKDDAGRTHFVAPAAALGMAEYSGRLAKVMDAVFAPPEIPNTLGQWVAEAGKRQFRLAETEKYPHVTFFLNGGVEEPFPGEDREMPPSPKVATYDQAPEMAAEAVAQHLVGAIREGYDLIVVNFANPDMVGHSGDLVAAVRACEAVDRGLGAALDALAGTGGAMIVTADHGNCEMMIDPETGGPHTAHTTNLVPVVLVEDTPEPGRVLRDGALSDLAPTVLKLTGLTPPPEMTGRSLIVEAPT